MKLLQIKEYFNALAILAVYRSVFDFVTDRHLRSGRTVLFILVAFRFCEYYPLGAICYFTGAVTAANGFCWAIPLALDCSLRPAVGGRYRKFWRTPGR